MEKAAPTKKTFGFILIVVVVFFLLYGLSRYNYLLFHFHAEMASIIIASAMFMFAWNARRFFEDGYLIFLGIAYLFVAVFDGLHTLAYEGMGVFTGYDEGNLAAQLWIASRYLESITMLAAPLFIGRKLRIWPIFLSYFAIGTLMILWIFFWQTFPDCFVPGEGLTPFKKFSEYAISLILLTAAITTFLKKEAFPKRFFRLIVASIFVTIASEMSFTLYTDPYGFANMLGHLLKMVSYYLIYAGIIETSLINPFHSIFNKLSQSEDRFRTLFEKTPSMTCEIDGKGFLTSMSNYWLDKMDYEAAEIIGKRFYDFISQETLDQTKRQYLPELFQAGVLRDVPIQVKKKSGDIMDALLSGVAEKDEKGNVVRTIVVLSDITDRKKAEEALKEKAAELTRSNEELEQFAYIASHDLQEPLRMVSSYTRLLEKRYGEKLDGDGREFLHFAMDGAARMQKLIEGLLAYSRMGRCSLRFEFVDLNRVFESMKSNLSGVIKSSGAILEKESLPTVYADPVQMEQLFQNLVGNGIKFGPKQSPIIRIHAEKEGEFWKFVVRDNGIGIDPCHHLRIFLIFQRLHTREEYPGTGIGLAISKRIVERHGGTIWVESAAGNGASFFFTIPIRYENVSR